MLCVYGPDMVFVGSTESCCVMRVNNVLTPFQSNSILDFIENYCPYLPNDPILSALNRCCIRSRRREAVELNLKMAFACVEMTFSPCLKSAIELLYDMSRLSTPMQRGG